MMHQQEFDRAKSAPHLPQAKGAFPFSAVKAAASHSKGKMARPNSSFSQVSR